MNYKVSFLAASIAMVTLLFSCKSNNSNEAYQQEALPTDFIQVTPSVANLSEGYPGTIEGENNAEIKAQVSGYLQEVYVKEGQFVNKGQALFKINAAVYNEQITSSEAALKSALANLETAKIEVEKLKPLVEGKVIADVQLKTAEANYQAAAAQVAQAKATLGSSKINSGFTLITAPTSGYIGRIFNRVGNLVSSTDAAPLTTLSNIATINVYFSMPESAYLAYAKNGNNEASDVELLLADGTKYALSGKLQTASGNIDRNTGSMSMKAVFSNPDKLLRAGGSARVIINRSAPNVIAISKNIVKDIQDKYFVFKLCTGDIVNMIPVEISGSTSNEYYVSSGLVAGDKVAINRIDMLTDSAAVVPKIVTISQ